MLYAIISEWTYKLEGSLITYVLEIFLKYFLKCQTITTYGQKISQEEHKKVKKTIKNTTIINLNKPDDEVRQLNTIEDV